MTLSLTERYGSVAYLIESFAPAPQSAPFVVILSRRRRITASATALRFASFHSAQVHFRQFLKTRPVSTYLRVSARSLLPPGEGAEATPHIYWTSEIPRPHPLALIDLPR